jgi:SAM-dependent methyltransferase
MRQFKDPEPPFDDGSLLEPTSPKAADATFPIDHVWGNLRVFLAVAKRATACQLGGDSLGAHLAALADVAVVIGDRVCPGQGWSAAVAREDAAPFADGSFDLVVVQDVARTERPPALVLAEARRLCRPTGYVVVGSSSLRAARQLRRELRQGKGSLFAALPGPRRPAVLFRPDDGQAATYFMRRVAFPYRSPGRGVVAARLEQLRNRAALATPATIALRAASGRVAVIGREQSPEPFASELMAFVRARWEDLGLQGPAPDRLAPLVIGHRRSDVAVVSALLFGGSETLVAKLPRYGGTSASLRRESAALEHVSDVLAGPVKATLPRSLGLHGIGDSEVLLQTAVRGRHLVAETASRRLHRGMLESQLDLMVSWCLDMQAASARPVPVVVDEELIDAKLVPLAKAGVAALGGDAQVEALLDRTLDRARDLIGTPLDLVVVHGDFWAGNVLVDRDRVAGVVDWERASFDDLPIWDLVKAVMDTAYHLDRYRAVPRRGPFGLPRWGELGPWEGIADPRFAVGFRGALMDPGWLADLTRDVLITAFSKARIPLGWLPVAVPFHLVREFVHPDASSRSVAGWGSVLRALASSSGSWTDEFAEEPGRGAHAAVRTNGERAVPPVTRRRQ